jgi:hypothetical protein
MDHASVHSCKELKGDAQRAIGDAKKYNKTRDRQDGERFKEAALIILEVGEVFVSFPA